jgi:hypothetical protein
MGGWQLKDSVLFDRDAGYGTYERDKYLGVLALLLAAA